MAENLDDFHVEPVRGLPERPPEGEHILWQGAPDWWALAREALSLYWVAGYFALLAAWRGLVLWERGGIELGLKAALPFLIMGAIACMILAGMAWVMARATVYTITNRRIALRIGAALTVTLNVPFTMLASADVSARRDDTGTIALELMGATRISYLVCWPHVRPWHMSKTQPALRAIPDVHRVAAILAEAATARIEERAQTVELRRTDQHLPAE